MNADIEQALANFFTARLASPFGSAVAVRPGAARAELPKDRRIVLAVVKECPRSPTRDPVLYKANAEIYVETPYIKGLDVTHHKALAREVLWLLEPVAIPGDAAHDSAAVTATKAELDAAVYAATGNKWHCLSTYPQGPKDQHAESHWQTVTHWTLCLTL